VEKPATLTLDAIKKMPRNDLVAVSACAIHGGKLLGPDKIEPSEQETFGFILRRRAKGAQRIGSEQDFRWR
jgi:DMSO/TMAO reductase YedYZ molybdopterin-dependent catalytic subunit